VQWCTKVKYLGLYLIGGVNFKTDLTVAKRKYYGSFNNIRSVVGRQANEIMVLHLRKCYCLPRLMYGCEIWPLNAVYVHEIDVLWKNGFRHVFLAVVGRKALSHFSFTVTACRYLINYIKDSCCFIDDYCSVIISSCAL